jgi:hypothetical protein
MPKLSDISYVTTIFVNELKVVVLGSVTIVDISRVSKRRGVTQSLHTLLYLRPTI